LLGIKGKVRRKALGNGEEAEQAVVVDYVGGS